MARPRKPVDGTSRRGPFVAVATARACLPGATSPVWAWKAAPPPTTSTSWPRCAGTGPERPAPCTSPEATRHPVHAEGAWSRDEHLDDLLKVLDARRELVEPAVGFTVRRRVVAVSLWVEAGSEVPEPLVAVRRRSIELLSTDLVRG